MSRCFPYPPPVYVRIGERGDAGSVKSTKLRKERNKIDTERRKEKKVHKEKNELLKKHRDVNACKIKRLSNEKSHRYKKIDASAGLAYISEESSRSGLSEEHNQPVPSSLFYCYGETDRNKKRKPDAPSPSTAESRKKIRIPFTFRQQIDTKGKEPVCSTSTLTSQDVTPIAQPAYQIINAHVKGPSSCSLKFIIGKKDATAECKAKVPSIESMYRALIEEWAAPSIVNEREVPDHQEWLFGKKQQDKKVPGRLQTETNRDELCPSIDDLWPRAHYLPDAEIFALGYTVPF